MSPQLCIPSKYDSERDYIDKMQFSGHTEGNEVMIFATVQITVKVVVIYTNGCLEWKHAIGTFR